jgi:hypothetical protein
MRSVSKKIALSILVALVACATVSAYAAEPDTSWEKSHPRRDQVNDRLKHQNERIHDQVKSGEMSKEEAASLHKEHRQIRKEERAMASQNGGHITKAEQKALNQQENAESKQIGK